MRPWHCLLFFVAAQSTAALAAEPPYYGPMKPLQDIGYKDSIQKDGSYRVVAGVRSGEAIDMAVYRAAELADQLGFEYVEMLGGSETRGGGVNSAILFARPSHTSSAPATCRSKRPGTCYTADVRVVLRTLGGRGGVQPGVAVADHLDRFGRQVTYSGYGAGATSPLPPVAIPGRSAPTLAPTLVQPVTPSASMAMVGRVPVADSSDPQTKFQRALDKAQPVQGRDPRLGWTVSD